MTLNGKVANCKVLYPIILYDLDIKFDFIQDHMKKNVLLCVVPFVGADHAINPSPRNATTFRDT